jgi:N-acetylglutamate synthase-like GNAT family acetyltransferase
MYARVAARLNLSRANEIQIVDYRPAYKKHFKRLNYEWLNEYFAVEPFDEVLLSDPNGRIIKRGGTVLFGLLNGDVVGTCALLKHGDKGYELAKMAVTEKARGHKVGLELARAIIAQARQLGAERLYLHTSTRLKAANRLYRKLNFKKVPSVPWPEESFERDSIVMRLDLTKRKDAKAR